MGIHDQEKIGNMNVCVPTGAVDTAAKQLAPRLTTIRGARIGILDNCKEFSDLVLTGVAEILKRDHGVREVTFWRKDYLGKPAAFVKEMAAACDAVINGVGHWGSSTPWTARDAAALEDLGIPTVTVISTVFAPLAKVTAEGIGRLSLPIVVVAHPVGDRDEGLVRKRGEEIAAECVRILTTPAAGLEREFKDKKFPLPAAVMPR